MQVEILKSTDRILALEIRPRWTGFAMFETPQRLLDWGTRKYLVKRALLPRVATQRIAALLDLHDPSLVVVRTRTVRSIKARRKIAIIMQIARHEARKRSIAFKAISANSVKKFFALEQCSSKHQRAVLITRRFPDLSWRLPPKRKMWKSEHHRMVIFDAVATALTFLNRSPPRKQ